MKTLAIGRKNADPRQTGFSLVEILVVLAIVGLLSATVVLSAPLAGSAARDDARRFAARLHLASQESVISGKSIGLVIDDTAYRFYGYRNNQWQVMEPTGPLGEVNWSDDVSLSVEPQTRDVRVDLEATQPKADVPSIVFNPVGTLTPFRVSILDQARRIVVAGAPQGDITINEYADVRP